MSRLIRLAILVALAVWAWRRFFASSRSRDRAAVSYADGSSVVNLTNTPDVDEVYPKVSPDGTKIVFCADEGTGEQKVRNLYVMDIDGKNRTKIADNSREPCWSGDSTKVAFLRGELDKFTPVWLAQRTAELIPNAEYVLVPGGSHTAPLERPGLVNHAIDRFLRQRVDVGVRAA